MLLNDITAGSSELPQITLHPLFFHQNDLNVFLVSLLCVSACVRACVRVCACVCVRACVHACVSACVSVCVTHTRVCVWVNEKDSLEEREHQIRNLNDILELLVLVQIITLH